MSMQPRFAALLLLLLAGCREQRPAGQHPRPRPAAAAPCPCAQRTLRLATTTSVDNTGLLEALLAPFRARTGIRTHVLAVGTGQALKLGERGDVDVVLVHDRAAEERFVARGFGLRRVAVAHNDFVLVGPPGDPAGARGSDIARAFARIAAQRAGFISRGDDSGTHKAELRLWERAGARPPEAPRGADASWYLEAGQGMRLTLNMAHEKRAYCFTDRATFLDAEKAIDLRVLVQGDPLLINRYSVIAVDPRRHRQVKHVEAMALVGWLTSPAGQRLIGGYRRNGKQLFHPDVFSDKAAAQP